MGIWERPLAGKPGFLFVFQHWNSETLQAKSLGAYFVKITQMDISV
jgi:hypothetical protein